MPVDCRLPRAHGAGRDPGGMGRRPNRRQTDDVGDGRRTVAFQHQIEGGRAPGNGNTGSEARR